MPEKIFKTGKTVRKTYLQEEGGGRNLRPWSSWTANSDKKYVELNGAALNVTNSNIIRNLSEISLKF